MWKPWKGENRSKHFVYGYNPIVNIFVYKGGIPWKKHFKGGTKGEGRTTYQILEKGGLHEKEGL